MRGPSLNWKKARKRSGDRINSLEKKRADKGGGIRNVWKRQKVIQSV